MKGRLVPTFYFLMSFLMMALLGYGEAQGSSISSFEIPSFYRKWTPEEEKNWTYFINRLAESSEDNIHVYSRLFSFLMMEKDFSKAEHALEMLEKNRSRLPREFKWLVAAFEVDRNRVSPETIADLRDALMTVRLVEKTWSSGIERELFYKTPGAEKPQRTIYLSTLNQLVFLHTRWQRLHILDPKAYLDPELEKTRVKWMAAFELIALDLTYPEMMSLMQEFEPETMRYFSKAENREIFFSSLLRVYKKMALRYGDASVDTYGNTRYFFKGPQKELFDAFKKVIKKWVSDDFEYLIRNYDSLTRLELTNADEVLSRQSSEKDRHIIESLMSHKDVNLDGFFVVNLLWLKNGGLAKVTKQAELSLNFVMSVLQNASFRQKGLVIKHIGFLDRFFPKESFYFFVRQFYKVLADTKVAEPKWLKALFKIQTLRTPDLTDEEWTKFEWLRIKVLRTQFDRETLKAHLLRVASGEESDVLLDRRIAAEFLRTEMSLSPAEVSEAVKAIKVRAIGVDAKDFKYVPDKGWAKNEAELVTVIRAIEPADPELHSYLSRVYTKRDMENPIAAQTALSHIAETGEGADEVKQEMIRKLQFVAAGDTAGTFRAFITLYPQEGAQILEIVYRHRGAKEKLIPMLKVLIEQSQLNLEILSSVHNAVAHFHDRKVANAEYMGQTLDIWLKTQLEKRGVNLSTENFCKNILNANSKRESP